MADASVKWYRDVVMAQVEEASQDALYEMAKELVELAAKRAPRRPGGGRLSKSGYAATQDKSSYVKRKGYNKEIRPMKPGVAVAAFAAFYARFVEWGTAVRAAQPFLRPALDESKNALLAKFVGMAQVKLGSDIARVKRP